MRDDIQEAISQSHPIDSLKLARCKGSFLQCHSIFCPSCVRGQLHHQRGRVLAACSLLPERRRKSLKLATFRVRDVRPQDLRDVAKESSTAVSKTLQNLGVSGSVTRLEVSSPDWSDEVHPHFHCLIDSPPSGRGFIPKIAFTESWAEHLPADLHAPVPDVHVGIVRAWTICADT